MTQFHIRAQAKWLGLGAFMASMGILSLPFAALGLILKGRIADVFNKDKLSEANFTLVWGLMGKPSPEDAKATKRTISQAYGVCLDLGPGTGHTVVHFDKSKVTKVFGIEPNKAFHPALQEAVNKAGLSDIYTIIGVGVQDTETLKKYGIEENSVDSVVACKVLCSIPQPKENIAQLYKILAPGGQFLVYEHVKAKNFLGSFLQDTFNYFWPFLMAGCNLARPTEAYLYGAGEWEEKNLAPAIGFHGVEVITFTQGRLIKKK